MGYGAVNSQSNQRKGDDVSKNTTAIGRGAVLAKKTFTDRKKKAASIGIIKIDKPNRTQRRAAKKQEIKP